MRQWFRTRMIILWQRNNPPIVSRGQNAAIYLPMIQQQRHQQTNKSIRKEYFNDNTKNEQSVSANGYLRKGGRKWDWDSFCSLFQLVKISHLFPITQHLQPPQQHVLSHLLPQLYNYYRWRSSFASSRSRIRTSLTAVASNSSRSTSEAPNSNFYCNQLREQLLHS